MPLASSRGFTLLEIVLALSISSILLYLGLGAYQHLRQDFEQQQAKLQLLDYSQLLHNYHQQHRSYSDSALQLVDSQRYDYRLSLNSDQQGFSLQALPIQSQSGSGAFSLDHLGDRRHYISDYPQGDYQSW